MKLISTIFLLGYLSTSIHAERDSQCPDTIEPSPDGALDVSGSIQSTDPLWDTLIISGDGLPVGWIDAGTEPGKRGLRGEENHERKLQVAEIDTELLPTARDPSSYRGNRASKDAKKMHNGGKKGGGDDNDGERGKKGGKKGGVDCVDLDEFPQWREEVGYWIGEYTLLQGDGTVRVSNTWPYPYNTYTGFITGNIEGGAYRQRNVFLYPPQTAERCGVTCFDGMDNDVVGDGECSVNGNSLVFAADQSGCSDDGSISGEFKIGETLVSTTTELVGADNALLYQVSSNGSLVQSQLTTLHKQLDFVTGEVVADRRTRTAQSFFLGNNGGTSYFREAKAVSKEAFYAALTAKIAEYNILPSDLCIRDGFTQSIIPEYMAGEAQCVAHLEQSFELGM